MSNFNELNIKLLKDKDSVSLSVFTYLICNEHLQQYFRKPCCCGCIYISRFVLSVLVKGSQALETDCSGEQTVFQVFEWQVLQSGQLGAPPHLLRQLPGG